LVLTFGVSLWLCACGSGTGGGGSVQGKGSDAVDGSAPADAAVASDLAPTDFAQGDTAGLDVAVVDGVVDAFVQDVPHDSGAVTVRKDLGEDVPDYGGCPIGSCDDGDPCTQDGCDLDSGGCWHTTVEGCYVTAAPCSQASDCKAGVCDLAALACVGCLSDANCSAGERCLEAQCEAFAACVSDADCKAAEQVCDKAVGLCAACVTSEDCGPDKGCVGHVCVDQKPCQTSKQCDALCDLTAGICVECLVDSDCEVPGHCGVDHRCKPPLCTYGACIGLQSYTCKPNGTGYVLGPSCDDGSPCSNDACTNTGQCVHSPKDGVCEASPGVCGTCQGGGCVASPSSPWDLTTGGAGDDGLRGLAPVGGGGFVAVGHKGGAGWLVRLGAKGEAVWEAAISPAVTSLARVTAMPDGSFVAVGDITTSKGVDLVVVRVDASGKVAGEHTHGGTAEEAGRSVATHPGGGVVVVGRTASKGAGLTDGWLLRLDAAGKLMWDGLFGGPMMDEASAVVARPDGAIVFAGLTTNVQNVSSVWLVKTDANGAKVWERIHAPSAGNGRALGIAALDDGGYVLVGAELPPGPTKGASKAWLGRTNDKGLLVWATTWGEGALGETTELASVTAVPGGLLAAGRTTWKSLGLTDGLLLEVEVSGATIFERRLGGPQADALFDVAPLPTGGAAIAGATGSKGAGLGDGWLVVADGAGWGSCKAALQCASGASVCNDGNACTLDVCDAVAACAHKPLASGTPCGGVKHCDGFGACK